MSCDIAAENFKNWMQKYKITGLNDQQMEAMLRVKGATLLLAVPGSGKTTVIVARTGYLMHIAGVDPKHILTLTYTKAAAEEMKTRFISKFQTGPDDTPKFSTINSFCVSVLSICAREKGIWFPRLIPHNEPIIIRAAQNVTGEYPSENAVRALGQKIGKVKNQMLTMEQIKTIDMDEADIDFGLFYQEYQKLLWETRQMDFDDQLIFAYNMLLKYPDFLARAQRQYQYVALDEAQDTSLIQHKIIQLLVGRKGNIFMVGDEDQSIYGFRGAYPAALLNFERDYDGAKVIYMEKNYRSDRSIVERANSFIKRNELRRKDKSMDANNDDTGLLYVTRLSNFAHEPQLLLKRVKEALADPDHDLAILFRNNESVVPLMSLLAREQIKVRLRDTATTYFTHPVIMDLLAFLELAIHPRDFETLQKIYFRMGCYVRKSDMELAAKLFHSSGGEDTAIDALIEVVDTKQAKQLAKVQNILALAAQSAPIDALDLVLKQVGYRTEWARKKTGKRDATSTTVAFEYKVGLLKLTASQYATIPAFLEGISHIRELRSDDQSNVTLSTIHSAKGLEWDKVIMLDVLDGILPPPPNEAMSKDDIEGEARLFYVGLTRARHEFEAICPLTLYECAFSISPFVGNIQQRDVNGNLFAAPISSIPTSSVISDGRFAAATVKPEVKTPLPDLQQGSEVEHTTFGRGKVTGIFGSGIIEITFLDGSVRRFFKPDLERLGVLKTVSKAPTKSGFPTVAEIRALYDDFDKQFHVDTSHMVIEIVHWKDSPVVADCRVEYTTPPTGRFRFNAAFFPLDAPEDQDDTIRHEYGHAAANLLNGRDCGHGPEWKKICLQLGCRPSPYAYNPNVPENPMAGGARGSVNIRCLRCGGVFAQAESSRTVKMLREGISSWNTVCPKCGGMRFEIQN